MKKYDTEQRKILQTFFRAHPDRQFAVEELAEQLSGEGGISVSAIYRNLGQMLEEGAVERFSVAGSRRFLYQYFASGECEKHIHLKCETCGQLFHLDGQAEETLLGTIQSRSHFAIDRKKSVLYGCCDRCRR
ncbi:MAG: transcriptional repressor [Oscillospiraceae bacterium]|nr:transcriptional repressor [Oscillospiraceae bacterium]